MSPNLSIAAVVLSGGRGTRMGGVNKGLVKYKERPLFHYACENLAAVTGNIFINTNTEKSIFREAGYKTLDDGGYPYQGPLAGLYAGLQLPVDYVAFAPCDQLSLPDEVYATLVQSARENSAAYARGCDDMYPTCSVISTDLKGTVREYLDNNQLRLRVWMEKHAKAVHFDHVTFANINQLNH